MEEQPNNPLLILASVLDTLQGKDGIDGEHGKDGKDGVDGTNGRDGQDGKDGLNGKDGIEGKDGKPGKTGPKGEKGDAGKDGLNGADGKDGKDGESVTPELLQQITTPIIVQNVQKAVSSKTYSASEIEGLANFVADHSGGADTFETVSKNLDATDAVLNYTGDNLTSIDYVSGITKTLSYTGDNLTTVVLSGSTPNGIDLTKTLSYTGDNLTGVTYS